MAVAEVARPGVIPLKRIQAVPVGDDTIIPASVPIANPKPARTGKRGSVSPSEPTASTKKQNSPTSNWHPYFGRYKPPKSGKQRKPRKPPQPYLYIR